MERSIAAESCWYSPVFHLHAAAACRKYAYAATRHVDVIDFKLQTTQELGASPNVMSWQESSNEVQMGPLHLALQFRQQECVSALLKHMLVCNLASEIHKNQ